MNDNTPPLPNAGDAVAVPIATPAPADQHTQQMPPEQPAESALPEQPTPAPGASESPTLLVSKEDKFVNAVTPWVKNALYAVTLSAVCFAVFLNYKFGWEVALAYSFAAGSLMLICFGLVLTSQRAQILIAISGIVLTVIGVSVFKPWDAGPHDPKIGHGFEAAGYKVVGQNNEPCVWNLEEKVQTYTCYLTIEPLGQKGVAPIAADPQPEAMPPSTPSPAKAG